jgi:hypothetical protein
LRGVTGQARRLGDDQTMGENQNGAEAGDVDMADDFSPTKPDWHLSEPTAHPDAVLRYINSDKSPPYLLRSTSKALFLDG